MLLDQLIDSSFIQYNCISDTISLHPLMVDTMVQKYPGFARGLPGLCGKPHPAAKPVYSLQISGETGASLPWRKPTISNGATPPCPSMCPLWNGLERPARNIFCGIKALPFSSGLSPFTPPLCGRAGTTTTLPTSGGAWSSTPFFLKRPPALEIIQTVPPSPERDRQLSVLFHDGMGQIS